MKKDCFGYKLHRCTALTEMICKDGGECPFYKTKEQFINDAEKAKEKNSKKTRGICNE